MAVSCTNLSIQDSCVRLSSASRAQPRPAIIEMEWATLSSSFLPSSSSSSRGETLYIAIQLPQVGLTQLPKVTLLLLLLLLGLGFPPVSTDNTQRRRNSRIIIRATDSKSSPPPFLFFSGQQSRKVTRGRAKKENSRLLHVTVSTASAAHHTAIDFPFRRERKWALTIC